MDTAIDTQVAGTEISSAKQSGMITSSKFRPKSSGAILRAERNYFSTPGVRPGTSHSRCRSPSHAAFDGNRKTVSRSSANKAERTRWRNKKVDLSSDDDSEDEDLRQSKRQLAENEFTTVDISDDKAYETDLEAEDKVTYDHTGRSTYIDACKRMNVIPASYFIRHMHDRCLDMKHHGLGAIGMKAIAISLASNTTLNKLNLSDNWLGPEGGLAVCEMLKENCFLTDLDLSDNKLGPSIPPAIAYILQVNTTITHLTLSGNDFDDNSAIYFAEAILNTTKLEYLNLSHNLFGEMAGMLLGPAIAENTSMLELDLSWNAFRRKGAIALAQGIKHNLYLKSVNLSWNGFALDGALAISDCLKKNTILEELDLANNRLTAEAAVLLGKGLSCNETLRCLKMGKNPMQSAGCYAICAAVLKNPTCSINSMDFSDILVNSDFNDIYKQVQEAHPEMKLNHGGMEPPPKPKVRIHPMIKLTNYIEKNNLRLVDFFNKFDKDRSMSVTHEEFIEGIEFLLAKLRNGQEIGINLTEDEIVQLIEELDKDGDGEINYSEMVLGHTDFQEKEKTINTVLTIMRPMTS